MIANDNELQCTQERIAWFQNLLARMRVGAKPEEYPLMSGGYLAEIDKMQVEIKEYLGRHASQSLPAKAS